MEIQNKQEILQYINRSAEKVDERARERAAEDKIKAILSADSSLAESRSKEVKAVNSFMTDPVNRQKLISYCFGFCDPTQKQQTVKIENGNLVEEVTFHAYLCEDELKKLYNFVERHKNDLSFADVVFKIIDKHGMTPSQVYRGVFMRRQDFSRVTNPKCKNVTRRMVWQIIVGLHCSLEEADAVLFSAGYIRNNSKFDLTMQYFIEHGNYDINAIDAVLEELRMKTFAC